MRHGTLFAYASGLCRCDPCRDVHNTRQIAARKRRTERLLAGEVQVKHGVYSTYVNWGCRCDDCKAAARVARGARR